jgi:glycosyltransferase involved in cell wall biosynthesis
MSDQSPLISVVMPFFNCESTLGDAIRSIMWQTYENWELLLFDDGSTDNGLKVAHSFNDPRLRIFSSEENKGLSTRLNQCVATARGDFIARMDSDDVSYPDRFEKQLAHLQSRPEIDLLGTGMVVFGAGGRITGKRRIPQSHEEICRRPRQGFAIGHPTWMGRASWFKSNPYNVDMPAAEDWELLFRTYKTARFENVGDILLGLRERLSVKKAIRYRTTHVKYAWTTSKGLEKPAAITTMILPHTAKALIEVLAMGSGLDYTILRHRARPVSASERAQWEGVWDAINNRKSSRRAP